MNLGQEMRESQWFDTHLKRTRDFVGSRRRICVSMSWLLATASPGDEIAIFVRFPAKQEVKNGSEKRRMKLQGRIK